MQALRFWKKTLWQNSQSWGWWLKKGFLLWTNANDMAIGATLMQEGKAIAYKSRKLNNVELNYLLAIIYALKV